MWICSPSVSTRARFTESAAASPFSPPAASTASWTRAPAASVTTEGCPTAPVTWTITSPEGGAEAVPPGPVPAVPSPPAAASAADPACCPASSSAPVAECCGAGRRRKKARTSTPSVAIATATSTGRRTRRGSTGSSSPAVSAVKTSPGTQPPRSALEVIRPAKRSSGDTTMTRGYETRTPHGQVLRSACGQPVCVHRSQTLKSRLRPQAATVESGSGHRLDGDTDGSGSHMRGDDRRQGPERGGETEFGQSRNQHGGIGIVDIALGLLDLDAHGVAGLGDLVGRVRSEGDDLLQGLRPSAHPGQGHDDAGAEAQHGHDLQ